MRKRVVVVFMLLVVCLSGTVWGQTSLTVNDGTATNSGIPMYGLFFDDYTKSECIIPSTSLTAMNGRTITAMTFYVSSSSTGEWDNTNQKVFLKEVAGTNLGGSYSGMNGATIVFDGRLPLPHATGAYTINFTTPYTYNGGNLLIGVYNDDDGTYHGIQWYGISGLTSGVSAYGYNGNNLNSASYNAQQFLPKVTFLFPCHPSFSSTTDYITNITLGSINNNSGFSTGGYGSYTNMSTDIVRGTTVNMSLTSSSGSGNHGAAVWIDFNDNGEFEASERVGTYPNSIQPNTTVQIPLTIPADAALGRHTMRVVYRFNTAGTNIDPCVSASYGEGEDYTVNITQPCTPSFSSTTDYITNITLGTINNSTGFSSGGYGDYTNLSTDLQPGGTATMSLSSSSGSGTHAAAVWIDFNDNGIFETDERVGTYDGIGASSTVNITLTIPANAPTGTHTMRVVYQYSVTAASINPCASASYGEGEDYTVNIISCTTRTANITNCPGTMISGQQLSLNGTVSAGGGTATWSSSNTGILSLSGNTVTAGTPGTATITYTRGANGGYCAVSTTCQITVNCATNNQTFAFNTTTGSVAEDATLNIAGYLTVPTGATVTSYTSANTSIATVTNAGVVTGVSTGTTTITATIAQWTYNGVTYCQRTTTNSFTVTVTSGCDESFNLSGNMTKTINCGTTYCFYDSGGKNGSYADNEDYTATFIAAGDITLAFQSFSTEGASWDYIWVYDGTADDGTALISGAGGSTVTSSVTAHSGIMTVVWHSDGSNTNAGWKAIIRGPECCTPARTLSITDCPAGSVGFGSTFTLHAQASAGGGTVTWQSSNPNIATVNGSGVVECVGIGTVTIIATISASGAYCKAIALCDINVICTDGHWNIDDIDGQTKTIECGKSYCFYDSGGPDGNYENNNENFSCSFSSSGIIHIKFIDFYTESTDYLTISGTYHDGAYSYTDISPGTEFVCTTEGGTINIGWTTDGSVLYRGWKAIVYAEGCCTHRDGESGFSFCRDHLNVAIGGTLTMPVDGADAVTPGGSVTYTSSNTNVATVDADGTVHGVAAGNATITATMAATTVSGVDYCAVTASYIVRVGIPSAGSLETSCEGFESGTLNGWTSSGDYTWTANAGYRYGTPAAHEGTYNAYISTTEWGNNESYLTSPVMDLSSAASATLSFWYINQIWGSDIDEIYAYYRTNNSDTWHQIFYTNANHESWTNDQAQNISLPNLSSTYQITFKVIGNYGYGVGLDNICISSESSFTPDVMPELTLTGVPSTVVCSPAAISIDAAVSDGTVDAAALSAALPSGLTYSTSTHKITGSLTTDGTYEFDIIAKSDDGCLKDTKHVTITVNQLDATIETTNP